MSKNKRGLGTPEEIEKRTSAAYTHVMVIPAKPRLRRDERKSAAKFKSEQQAILNKDGFNHRYQLNLQLVAGTITKHQHQKLQQKQQIFRSASVFPESSYNTPVKKTGKIRSSLLNLRQKTKDGARITSEINRLARIERRRLWQIKEAEVKALIKSL